MLQNLLALLFIFKCMFKRNEHIHHYLRRKYDVATLSSHRLLERKLRKLKKAQLDLNFLLTCKLNNVVPNFLKFKLYKSSLYNSDFYHDSVLYLLNLEITSKEKSIAHLNIDALRLEKALTQSLTFIDNIYVRSKLSKVISVFCATVEKIHNQKFNKLGVSVPKFSFNNNVIFNHSSYHLSNRENFLLSLGLDFSLPCFKPKFVDYFLPFEKLATVIKPICNPDTFIKFRKDCSNLAYSTFTRPKQNIWYPFLKQPDINILKKLSQNKNLVITKPDKGKGVVLLDRSYYNSSILSIIADNRKFNKIGDPNNFQLIFKIEDKINRFLLKLKTDNIISDDTYDSLHCTGSSFGILYGSPKIHKPSPVPLRPILAAYNLPSYKIAKFLVPLLSSLTTNQFSVKNSHEFSQTIKTLNPDHFLVSFDVESLFTNVPLQETIEIILNSLFKFPNQLFSKFNRSQFKNLLELSVLDSHFIFNNELYKQTEGMAMGSPLGPTFANIFMNNLESKFLNDCPSEFLPVTYHRYVDDTLTSFSDLSHAQLFLNYINQIHPNINFTMDIESDNKISFLDILITRFNNKLFKNVFRKWFHWSRSSFLQLRS